MLKKITAIVVSLAIMFLAIEQSEIVSAKKGNMDTIEELNNNKIHLDLMKSSNNQVISLSLGGGHSGAITKDGSLYMWGSNFNGQLGIGTTEHKYIPIKVLDNIESVCLSDNYSGAITKDSDLYMWGYNGNGQLGDGTLEDQYTPVKVLDDVKSVSLSGNYSGAITKDSSLYMWGINWHGELGDKTTYNRCTPVKILDNVESVSLSNNYSGAITKDGSLYMWGENWNGALGDNTTERHLYPIKIDLLSNSDDIQSKTPNDTQLETVSKKVSQKITYKSSAIKKGTKGKQVIYGSSFSLNAKTSGTGNLTYKSSNSKILSVNTKGQVKVKGYGPVYIKIKASGGNGYKTAILGIKLTAVPRQGKITKAEWRKTGIYFNWRPEKTVDGYEYAIAYNKKFVGQGRKKTTKTGLVMKKYKTNAKKMYIRVRNYKKVGKKTYYGNWSEPKALKLKKSKKSGQSAFVIKN